MELLPFSLASFAARFTQEDDCSVVTGKYVIVNIKKTTNRLYYFKCFVTAFTKYLQEFEHITGLLIQELTS